jgi:hypothetical protein
VGFRKSTEKKASPRFFARIGEVGPFREREGVVKEREREREREREKGERSKVDDNWNPQKENAVYFGQHIILLYRSKHLQYALFKCLLPKLN